jgi:protein SCO1
MKRNVILVVALIAVLAGLAAGYMIENRKEVKGYPGLGGGFTLQSGNGEISLEDFRDQVVVLYFGFVNCPDACPMTMGKVSVALNNMTPEQREQVRVLMISVDPERDTPESVSEYMAFFGEEFVGATGTPDVIAEVANRYHVLYQNVDLPDSALGYTVDHTSNTFIIGRQGVVRFIVSHGSDHNEYRDRIVDAINGV